MQDGSANHRPPGAPDLLFALASRGGWLLALSLDCVQPKLDAGTYLVALRAAESAGASARFVLHDLEGELVTSLPAEGLSFGGHMPSRVGVSEGHTLVFELFVDDERGLGFRAQLSLQFPSETFGSEWR